MSIKVTKMGDVEPFYDECGPVRGVWRNEEASLARLTMKVGGETKPHYHKATTEVYTIERGTGKLIIDGEEVEVTAGDLIEIVPGAEHQLINIGDEELELGVVCTPPFDPSDIYIR